MIQFKEDDWWLVGNGLGNGLVGDVFVSTHPDE